tara:strand:+ start:174 stop:1094 length:921 start_codon:yes stop_codon:yes gene_type:complete
MIDFFKAKILNTKIIEENLIGNGLLHYKAKYDSEKNKKLEYPKIIEEDGLKLVITEHFGYLSGSLHKFNNLHFHQGDQNYNDFKYSDLKYLIPYIEESLTIGDINKLIQLEVGFNIQTNYDPKKFIINNVYLLDFQEPTKITYHKNGGITKEFSKTDLILKIYDKGKQYKLTENILRIEIRITKSRFLKSMNLYSLKDITNKDKLYYLFKKLLEEFEPLIILDTDWKDKVSIEDKQALNEFLDPKYWANLKYQRSYKVRKNRKDKFYAILEKYNLEKQKISLMHEMGEKFVKFINEQKQPHYEFPK